VTDTLTVTREPPRTSGRRRPAGVLSAVAAVVTVALNIAYPLAGDTGRDRLSVLTVGVFALASVSGAWAFAGRRAAVTVFLVAAGTGLVAEVVGVSTGIPFGDYSYADSLGTKLAGVPLVVPLAWVMMAWPAWIVGTALAARLPVRRPRVLAWLAAGWALASWDLFLDPQMVAAGHWTWTTGRGAAAPLPGVPGIPVSNYLGWLGVSLVVTGALALARVPGATAERVPGPATALYLWTWVGGVVANAAFFDRPAVAVVGGVGMGLVGIPFAVVLLRRRAARPVGRRGSHSIRSSPASRGSRR